jgi:TolA-binding protein
MRPKYKVTGCARFFLFFLFFVPAVFFGAAYMRGENGVQIIKDFYHSIVGGVSSPSTDTKDLNDADDLQKQLNEANEKIEDLEKKVEEQEKEIELLKNNKK